ncbi:HNH endonuclease [Streptomyces sp. NPDC012769]|uniref:HNH endonuclease n=1 Tax=Streptomyces sp. NPDC012769 TaxID=3364848 RepID=UPI0036BC013F
MRNRRSIKRYRYSSKTKKIPLRTLYARDNGVCAWCGKEVPFYLATRDHRIPKSKGGSNKSSNLQLMCFLCNQLKGNAIVA